MCGIICQWKRNTDIDTKLIAGNNRRGPDFNSKVDLKIGASNLLIHGFVLHLRGNSIQPQPLIDSNGNVLVFNGEIYDGISVAENENDTFVLSTKLENLNELDICKILSSISGEWALAYYHSESQALYFGRDFLGKRSLLWHRDEDSLIIATTSGQGDYEDGFWSEIPTTGIFKATWQSGLEILPLEWNIYPNLSCPKLIVNSEITDSVDPVPINFDNTVPLDDFRQSAAQRVEELLDSAVKKRIESIPTQEDGKLAVLFSGGVDCIVLAALAHRHVPPDEPIDLLNVAFENPRSLKNKSCEFKFLVPDRLTGRQGFDELQLLFPTRKWRFVEVNVEYEEFLEWKPHVMNLMRPLYTVMDLSIAIAFWFASRGQGLIIDGGIEKPFQSKAKVLFSGLGADEQLGGYSRHRTAFLKGGWLALANELSLDVGRISSRNLGRDDRIVGDHGKELRFPFLDRNLISYLCSLPVHYKTDPRLPREIGDKILIRIVASRLGLKRASTEAKRAVQFGAKTAKMELNSQKSKGHDLL